MSAVQVVEPVMEFGAGVREHAITGADWVRSLRYARPRRVECRRELREKIGKAKRGNNQGDA